MIRLVIYKKNILFLILFKIAKLWVGWACIEATAGGQRAGGEEHQAAGEAAGPGQAEVQEAAQVIPGGRARLCHHSLRLR